MSMRRSSRRAVESRQRRGKITLAAWGREAEGDADAVASCSTALKQAIVQFAEAGGDAQHDQLRLDISHLVHDADDTEMLLTTFVLLCEVMARTRPALLLQLVGTPHASLPQVAFALGANGVAVLARCLVQDRQRQCSADRGGAHCE